jgi:hypothetical protein
MMNKKVVYLFLGIVFLMSLSSCKWVSLTYNALTYRTTAPGEAANVVTLGSMAFVTLGSQGFEVVDVASKKIVTTLLPPEGSESVDDLAISDGFLFALDATSPGHLSVFSLANPEKPVLVSEPIPVAVGPFSGVSAGGGHVIVSGGTSELSLHAYDPAGKLKPEVATIDLGRGQPDVLLAPDGKHAFVSTHFFGPEFGLTLLDVNFNPLSLKKLAQIKLEEAGFTAGGAKPANFPIEMALQDTLLLVAHSGGIAFFDVRNLEAPKLLNILKLEIKPVNVDVNNNIAAVVGSSPKPGLILIDVKNPEAPRIIRSVALDPAAYPTGVAITPTHVVVAAHEKGFLVFQQ